jgi:hypothetical protein
MRITAVTNSRVSNGFVKAVKATLATMPPEFIAYLESRGAGITVASTPERLPGADQGQPQGKVGDHRTNINECQAWCKPPAEVCIAEQFMLGGQWTIKGHPLAKAIPHELGHAFDFVASGSAGQLISCHPDFIRAYEADVAALGGVDGAVKRGLGYFVGSYPGMDDPHYIGREEVVAEWVAAERGTGAQEIVPGFRAAFPRTGEWIRQYIKGHEAIRAQAPEAVRNFHNNFVYPPNQQPGTAQEKPLQGTTKPLDPINGDYKNITKRGGIRDARDAAILKQGISGGHEKAMAAVDKATGGERLQGSELWWALSKMKIGNPSPGADPAPGSIPGKPNKVVNPGKAK